MTTETPATPAYARPPTDELSSTLRSYLTEAEAAGPRFDTRDLCLLVALAARAESAEVPAGFAPLLGAAFQQLGLPEEPSPSEIDAAIARELSQRPLAPELLQTLESFRVGGLSSALQQRARQSGEAVLGHSCARSAPNVEDRPQLTARQLQARSPGKTIIR